MNVHTQWITWTCLFSTMLLMMSTFVRTVRTAWQFGLSDILPDSSDCLTVRTVWHFAWQFALPDSSLSISFRTVLKVCLAKFVIFRPFSSSLSEFVTQFLKKTKKLAHILDISWMINENKVPIYWTHTNGNYIKHKVKHILQKVNTFFFYIKLSGTFVCE